MKKRMLVVALTIVLIFNMVAYGATAPQQLLKNYRPNFEYSNESIGRMLKSATVMICMFVEAELSYRPIVIESNEIVRDIIQLQSANPDVETSVIYQHVLDNIYDYMYLQSARSTDTLATWSGSGIAISENGYIATNRHVIEPTEDAIAEACVQSTLKEIIVENYASIIESIESVFGSDALNGEQQEQLFEVMVNAYIEEAELSDEQVSYKVLFPGPGGEADVDISRALDAEVINYGDVSDAEDAAIIKIDAENMVAVKLAEDYPAANSPIWAAGFPGNADMGQSASTLVVTITSGIVSAVKSYDDSSYKVIQIDAAVDHGNSGGPSVDKKLNVVGLNTFSKSTDTQGNFNFMISSKLVNDLAYDVDIGQGDVSKIFMLGLQAMDNRYGKTAVECFQYVKQQRPATAYIDELISEAESLPQQAMSGSGGLLDSKLLLLLGALVVIILIIIIIAASSNSKKKKKNTTTSTYNGFPGEPF